MSTDTLYEQLRHLHYLKLAAVADALAPALEHAERDQPGYTEFLHGLLAPRSTRPSSAAYRAAFAAQSGPATRNRRAERHESARRPVATPSPLSVADSDLRRRA